MTPFQLSQVCHTSHIDHRSTQVTIVSNYTFPPVSCLLLCMDVEPNPGPQQIRISNLPNSIKLLFNQVKRTRLKITRYQSHLDNLLAYKSNNLVPKGLKPKCTPAIHSSNPSFWSKWQKNLDNLASVQLDLLLDETNNCIRQLKSTFDNQQQVLRASLNNDTLNAKLSNDMEDMASKLQLNLNQLRTKKLNNMLHTRTSTDRANLQTVLVAVPIKSLSYR